ncbi:alpha-ketoglutarate-dependent dioxygenase alkB homolog 7, mitochondrial isoform X2 [Diorhabda carinulata]|uniref:alpha-ketoglutarate-dependent dioxygenase alkB homolog 7, mitochondrial isoform X2 n=1 Tax=Diorhabda carinulata TaxID=1163345 RepID=UPI0025A0C50B|nr:alpha-ketoglutarate-dependent dioxygenase alkB homolog 7, mitochondrial isoform X2 [Diorhabda carinulata]
MQVSFFRNYLKFFHCYQHVRFNSLLQGNRSVLNDIPSYIALCPELTEENVDLANNLINSMVVIPNFLSEIDENSILAEIEPYLRKMRYEFDHWDNAIHGFRETERLKWNETNTEILNRFCGDTIAGLSLLTDSVMRLVNDKNKNLCADILLKRRSLYIMKNFARFDYTHEILSNERSVFKGEKIFKDRRISVICRNEPDPAYKT